MEFLFLVIGLITGSVLGWLFFKSKNPASPLQDVKQKENELSGERNKVIALNIELSKTKTEYSNLELKLKDQKNDLENLQTKFTKEFENLANRIFEEKGKVFAEQNKTNLNEVLSPLKERIKDFEKKVDETYDKESKQRFSLEREIKNLIDVNQKISKEANDLTNALKGQAKTLGNWGEIILESILDKSGLVKDREYFLQQSYTDEEGKRLQPDVIVKYPGDKSIIIDSKVSLLAYDRYSSSESKTEQDEALAEHLISVKNHIIELSKKNYQDIYQIKTLDFVMMFVPIEPAYMLAVQGEPELWNFAYERRILLISPTNLIAALKMINSLWQQENQNKNAIEIARQAGALYDKFVGFIEDLTSLGSNMQKAQSSYDDAMNKLHEGKGNLVRGVEKIRELGVKASKTIPQSLIDKAEE
jgi:DNA recombination protein RmuC